MYTTTGLGLAVKTVMERPRSLKFERYALQNSKGTLRHGKGRYAKMTGEFAAEVNNALSEGGSDYRWVLVEGGE